mmetsp:Transcript_1929/g.2764  ORF Transcript_1929/g.2764 Transcript_1929/m.2764 type:complete len:80 (+) Transcript_1929:194-433(+)
MSPAQNPDDTLDLLFDPKLENQFNHGQLSGGNMNQVRKSSNLFVRGSQNAQNLTEIGGNATKVEESKFWDTSAQNDLFN